MAFNSNGQISYLVLDSLSSGSKYGLEIIEYISKKTGGAYIMKKPTLYSCLTRMEKKGLVSSSYWGESELGGKRHYYSITTSGRQNLEELSRLFANSNFENVAETPSEIVEEEKPTILHQGNIFDMVKEEKVETKKEPESNPNIIENQIDIFNMDPITHPISQEEKKDDAVFIEERAYVQNDQVDQEKMTYYQNKLEQSSEPSEPEIFDGGKFLDESERLTPDQEEQNKRIYDTSSELKKYRKRKSFSENQIEMAVVYEDEDYDQIQKERIAELKKSLLNIKQNGEEEKKFDSIHQPFQPQQTQEETSESDRFSGFSKPIQTELREDDGILFQTEYIEERPFTRPSAKQSVEDEEEITDDAILITEPRMADIPIQRKITPPNIEVNLYDDNLPAPKRNSELEPTYKDMMAKLFEGKKEKDMGKKISNQAAVQPSEPMTVSSFADYSTLKRYYNTQGITFKEYKKSNIERKHNTNLLNFISSAILLLLSGLGSAIIFGIISGTNNLKSGTNFMFYTLPILFLVLTAVDFCLYKFTKSKKQTLFYNAFINWIIFILSVAVIFGINALCKMQFETIGQFATSLFIPILGVLLLLPVNFHIRKFLYSKYGK